MNFTFSDKRTSLLIGEQVPEFLHEYGPKFIKFIEKYYEWMETSRVEVTVEYINDNGSDLTLDLSSKIETDKPQIQGLHTNSLSRVLSADKIDRNNYIFQVKHYNKDFEVDLENPTGDPSPPKHSIRNEITKGYSVDESLIFLNDPYSDLTGVNGNIKLKVKSFIQQPTMASKNTWNSNDIDLTLNSHVDLFMKEFLEAYPLSFPSISESLDINDKVNENQTVEDFKRFLVKHSREFYQSKGTEDSFRYLFRTVYNKEIDMYYPEDDILKASDNTYYNSRVLRMLPKDSLDIDLKSRYVTGETSGATAVIENYYFKKSFNRNLVELELNSSTIKGVFSVNENLKIINDEQVPENIGTVLSSLQSIEVLKTSTEKFNLGEKIILDKNLNRIQLHEIPLNLRTEYIELEVEKLEEGRIYGFEISNPGKGYSLGDKILFDNEDVHIKSSPKRFLKAYVSELCHSGSIKKIKVVCEGRGYVKLPKIVSIGNREYDESDSHNAVINFISENVGKAKTIKIINNGFDYGQDKVKIDLNGDSNHDLELNFGSISDDAGEFLNNKGFLSDTKVLQDSFYYQKFSYVIKSDVSPKDYKDLVKRLVHPAGTKFFGEYYITSQVDASVKVNQNKVSEIELNDRNHIGKYSNTVLDEWNLYDNFDNTEIRQNDLIPTVIENDDDYKFLKLSGTVSLNENSDTVVGTGTDFLTSISSGDFIMIQDQGFEVVSVVSDLEMTLSQQSNETLTSENVLIRTSQIDTAG
tara:strand:- start:20592 stop:22847 length:2256 start_codon:yes stop_codon:yes gene_type:complete